MEQGNFYRAAKYYQLIGMSDEELLNCIEVLNCLITYFEERGSSFDLVTEKLVRELDQCKGFARSRKLGGY